MGDLARTESHVYLAAEPRFGLNSFNADSITGANIHHKNYFHCTAAHWACMGDMDSEFLDFLQSFGVDFSPPNNMGHTPLGKAAFKGIPDHQKFFLTLKVMKATVIGLLRIFRFQI